MVDARIQRSRDQLRAALIALLAARPLDQISVRDIAAAAGVGYTTFFRHYPGKEALLDAVAAEEIARLTALTVPVYAAGDSYPACLALCRHVDAHRPLWTALLTGGASGVVRQELLRQGRAVVAETLAPAGDLPPDLPPDLGVALVSAAIFELLSWWLAQAEPWPAERVAAVLDRNAVRPAGGGA